MLYMMLCEDKPNSESLRQSVRADHLQYIADFPVRFAGPLLAEDETTMVGSLIILEAESLEAAQGISASDPYTQAELFARVTIRPIKQAILNP